MTPDQTARLERIHCCGCGCDVQARLTDGREVYPHRRDLYELPFWKCDLCWNFVGCHHKSRNRTAPLGCIPTPELKEARKHLHAVMDPIWRSGRMSRRDLYAAISAGIGREFHAGELRSVEDARAVEEIARRYA